MRPSYTDDNNFTDPSFEYDDSYEDLEDGVKGHRRVRNKKSAYAHKSKASSKSKHKHIYEDCLLETPERKYYKATRCKICGKIGDRHFFELTDIPGKSASTMIPASDLRDFYPDLPVYYVDDLFDKFA